MTHCVIAEVVGHRWQTCWCDSIIESGISVQFYDGNVIVEVSLVVLLMFCNIDNAEHLWISSILVILEMMFSKDHSDQVISDTMSSSENMSGGDQSSSTQK